MLTLSFDPDGLIESDELGISAGGSREAFVEAARRLWSDPELRRQMGDRGPRLRRPHPLPRGDRAQVGRKLAPLVRD